MKITALLYNPPGRGECLKRELHAPDSEMPVSAVIAGERSVNAMRHFFPGRINRAGWASLPIGRALVVKVESQRIVVEGSHWELEWAEDAYIADRQAFVERIAASAATPQEFIERADSMAAAMVCHLTQNHNQGVPA